MSIRDAISVPPLVRLYDVWDAKRRGRRCPARHDLDPLEMAFVLGSIDLIEASGDPLVFRFRVSGGRTDEEEGFSMQGKTLDDYPFPKFRERLRAAYLAVLASGEPDFAEVRRIDEGRIVRHTRLILPLAADGRRIDMLLIGRVPLAKPWPTNTSTETAPQPPSPTRL